MNTDKLEYAAPAAKIELMRNRIQKLKQQTERELWEEQVKELQDYLVVQETKLVKV
ncbi:MAG: hypothetical protein QME62_07335 [Armatimonadota bacterium]|nr:hypothetical protein [Armatimonadota bacterium]MDI6880818.1 hypothetical protein [Desulfitobacteriaceae bacterium]MDI6915663.1 hypothetical protein [Desulfitobacteriaceae bacterium]